MTNSLQTIYEEHHKNDRQENFVLLGDERGNFFAEHVGANKRILDIGCRDGALTKYFCKDNDILGVDIDNNALVRAQNNLGIKTKWMDLNGSWDELDNEEFDAITAGEIIEHLYYPGKVIKKITNHLKVGGIFVGSIPNAFSLKNRLRYLLGSKKIHRLQTQRILISFLIRK